MGGSGSRRVKRPTKTEVKKFLVLKCWMISFEGSKGIPK
jgi:hypothetical protein